jgi:hypothetical protein
MHLHESAMLVLNEQRSKRNKEILREAFQYDVRRLEEARAYADNLLNEGVLSESVYHSISDEYLLDEGIFDTLKALGKNVGGAAVAKVKDKAQAAAAAIKSKVQTGVDYAKAEYAKAKEQGNAKEMERLQARLAQLQKGAPAAPAPAAAPTAAAKRLGRPAKAAPAAAPAAPAPAAATPAPATVPKVAAPVAADPAAAKPPVITPSKAIAPAVAPAKAEAPSSATNAVAVKAMTDGFTEMAKNDPENFKKLALAATAPGGDKKVEALINNPQAKAEAEKIQDELANSPEAQKSPGLLGKVKTLWSKTREIAKKHPIMFWGGLGLAAAVGGLAVVGAGGVGALAAAVIAKVAASTGMIATGAAIGGAVSGAKEIMAQKKAGGKIQWGKVAKAAGTGALKRAGQTLATVAATAVGGEALKGASKVGSEIANAVTPAAPAAAAAAPAAGARQPVGTHSVPLKAAPAAGSDVTDYDANGAADSFMNRLKGGSGSMGGALDANSLVNDKTFKGLTGGFGNSAGVNQHYAEKAKDIAQMWTQAWQQGKINDAQLKGHLVDVFAGRFK